MDVNDTAVTVSASDPDLQGALVYEIRGVAPGSNYFSIDSGNGAIRVKKPLNTETATAYLVGGVEPLAQLWIKSWFTKHEHSVKVFMWCLYIQM